MRLITTFLLLVTCIFQAQARPRFKFGNVEIGGMRVSPANWESTAFIDLAWTPMWSSDNYGFHGILDITAPRNASGARFIITTYGAAAFLRVFSLINIEVSGGLQTWRDTPPITHPLFGVAVLMRVGENLFDRIYLSMSWYQNPSNPAKEFRVGSSFNIF